MRRIYTKRTEHVNDETGEVTYTETESSFFVRSRHFVKMYLDHIHLLQDVSGGARYVLDIILIEMEFNENTVYISPRDRKKLAEIIDKSEHTVRNYLYELQEADVIAKVGTSIYKVNPNLFAKGTKGSESEYEAKKKPSRNGKSPM